MSDKFRHIDAIGFQNFEKFISEVISEQEFYAIDEVRLEGKNLVIGFSKSNKKRSNFAKQVSKKKHNSINEYLKKNQSMLCGKLIGFVELKEMWVLFFEK